MNESNSQPLEKQIDHNERQPHRYVRLWASRDERFILRGTNSFGDECARTFDSFDYLLIVSIVSARCGAKIVANRTFGKKGFTLILPAEFIRALALSDGTFVDLLQIARVHFGFRPINSESNEQSFARLILDWELFVGNTQQLAQSNLRNGCPAPAANTLRTIYRALAMQRMPATAIAADISPEGRAAMAKIFGDMSFGDYLHLAYAVVQLFHESEAGFAPGIAAPVFRRNCVARIDTWHHGFVLLTTHLGAGNNEANIARTMDMALAASKAGFNGQAREASLLINYSSTGFSDYHYPSTIGLIPRERAGSETRQTFAESLMDVIVDEAAIPSPR